MAEVKGMRWIGHSVDSFLTAFLEVDRYELVVETLGQTCGVPDSCTV